MLRRQGCDGAATMLRLCCDDALPTHPLGPSKPARCVQPAHPPAGRGGVRSGALPGFPTMFPRRCSRCPRCSRTGFPTMFRQQGCDGAATGLRRCRTNASGCPSDDAPATVPDHTTYTPRTHHRSPRNAPSKPARCDQPARPPAGCGGVRSAAGVPSDVPPTMLDVPDDGPGDGFGDRQCSRTPAGAGCQATRLSGCHSLPGHQARPDSPRSSQLRRWLPQARQDTQTELGQDFRHGCLESERCKP